ncbi:MAG: FAD-dependent oxidoreductase [Desulfovibrionales bacterium]
MAEENPNISGKHQSLWMDTTQQTSFPPLGGDRSVDVAVVGAGLTGLNTAFYLARAGAKVLVLDANSVAAGVSGHSSAKITSQHGLIYTHLVSTFGHEHAELYARANQTGMARYEEIIRELGIECDLEQKDAVTYSSRASDVSALENEVSTARKLGLPARFSTDVDLPFPVAGAIVFSGQGQFHPRKYLLGLIKELLTRDVTIVEQTRALEVSGGSSPTVRTDQGTITAKQVILASHSPGDYSVLLYPRMKPKRSYVLGVETAGDLPSSMYYSTEEPFHSLRTHPFEGKRILLVGGQNHQTGHHGSSLDRYQALERYAREFFRVERVRYSWSTQDQLTMDRVPYIGKVPVTRNVFLATGFGGWGIAHAMVAGMLLSDLVLGKLNDWKMLYDPGRVDFSGMGEAARQNVHFLTHVVKDHLPSSQQIDPSRLEAGQGETGKIGRHKVALSRDLQGDVHAVSPICTHMGCAVNWNDGELSWDCPCHGSRFDQQGRVLNGPAVEDLEGIDLKK